MSEFEPKQFGRYLLIDKLAVGGMAEIYKAKTYGVDGFEKLLAIKRILPHCSADKEFITMLVDEAKLTVLLSHANIVQVYDLGKVGDDYYISMEFIHGTNLRELIHRVIETEGKAPEEISVYTISEICKGLDYAHRKTSANGQPLNIVHRDINPQNILISFEGEVKIVDFGIAKAASNVSHTMAGVLKGKIAYMSPEQALGKPLDGRTDIFSVGLVLYEMITGKKFFTGDTQFEVLDKIRTTRISMTDLPAEIPGSLRAIICKSLAHNAKDRYQSASDMHLDLTKYLYASYIDFSPRALSSLVHDNFSTELKAAADQGPAVNEKTRSLLIKASTGESLVIEEAVEPSITAKGAEPEGETKEEAIEAEEVSGATPATVVRRKKRRLSLKLATLLVLGIAGTFAWNQFDLGEKATAVWQKFVGPTEPTPPPKLEIAYGSIIVSSEPSNAAVKLNDKNIGKTTPATLSQLELGKEFKISIEKDHYKSFEKTVSLMTRDPAQVHGTLVALSEGVLDIASKPVGAKIFLNGKDTEKLTPSKIDGLEIKKEYSIQLKKEGYSDWSSTVPVNDFRAVTLRASLTKIPDIKPPEPPPAPKPEPTPVVTKTGTLLVKSNPSRARVYLNGKNTGQRTPATLKQLALNKFYSIKLRKSGYESWSKNIKVKKESGETLRATLSAVKAVEKPRPPPEREPTPKPVITTKPEPAPPPPKPTTGGKAASLKIRTDPSGADVYVNAEYKGTSPVSVSGLRPGSAQVMIRKRGYLEYNSSVSLKSGEKKSLGTIRLEGLYGEIKVESNPPRASVIFNGKRIGATTPVTIRKVPRNRTHTLRVELGGYKAWQTSVDMRREGSKRYNVRLKK